MRHGSARPVGDQDPGGGGDALPERPPATAPDTAREARISLYRGERRPGSRYRELWTGPGVERLLGAELPPDVDPGRLVLDRIAPEDRERVERLFAYEALLDVDSVETDYRVLGLDGETRIIRDRGDVRDRDAERVVFSGSLVDVTAERRAVDRLDALVGRLRAAATAAGLALWEVDLDADGGHLSSDVVPGLHVLLGGDLPPGDPAAAYAERVHADDRAAFDAHIEALAGGGRGTAEYRLRGVDGRTRWIWTRAEGGLGPAGRTVVGVSADVTERRRDDEELLGYRRHVASLLETVRLLLVTAEFDADGRIRDVRAHGRSEHFIGRALPPGPAGVAAWLDHVHPDDRARVDDRLADLAGGAALDTTYRVRHADGTDRRVRSHARRRSGGPGDPVTVDLILLDVTEAELTAAALEDTEQRLAHVLHAIDDVVYSVDVTSDGRLGALQANDRWYALFGRPDDRVSAAGLLLASVHPADRPRVEAAARRLAAGEAIEQEYRIADVNGRERWLLDRAWPRRRADGSLVADGIQVDITERRRFEHDLRVSRAGATRVAAEQTALREVATAIAARRPADELFSLAALAAGRVVDGDQGWVVRFDGDVAEPVGVWSRAGGPAAAVLRDRSGTPAAALAVRLSGRPERRHAAAGFDTEPRPPTGVPTTEVAAPVRIAGHVWGAVSVSFATDRPLAREAEARVADVADLVALAVSEAETRRLLSERALSDPLTGLANHRAFHDQLRTEVVRARRYDRRLSLVLLDVDHFKAINDSGGHPVGDAMLQHVADVLRSLVRNGELVGRVGGDELALLLPETDAAGAAALAERARHALAREARHGGGLTVSAGVAELSGAIDAEELYRQADRALLWTKRHGRNGVWRYDPRTMRDGTADDHDGGLARSHAQAGLHALARAVDLREPRLAGHAERVAALADRLADRLGWASSSRGLLREAALLHDVGRIGAPADAPGTGAPLDRNTPASARSHPVLGAEIVAEVLAPEQTSWIRHHHERWDGTGYPDGLRGDEIPDGAALIGLAEAWDARTGGRPRSVAEALADCVRESGGRFAPIAVEALRALAASGDLPSRDEG